MGARRPSTACLSVALAALVFAGSAAACSCAPQPPGESLRESDGAIVARLVEVLPRGPLHAEYRYEVRRVYRGAPAIEPDRMLGVHSARRDAACALPRRIGRAYGLFLSHRHGRWFSGICGVIAPRRLRHAVRHQPRLHRRSSGQGIDGCPSSG